MRTVEMLRDTRPIYHLALLVFLSVGYVQPLPLQVLPDIPGYIPVYIRYGDQPLEEINPALAEAFNEKSSLSKNINLDNIPVPVDLNVEETEGSKYKIEAVRVRQVDKDFSDKDEDSIKPPEKISKSEKVEEGKGSHYEKSRKKEVPKPGVKLLPLTEEERKTLEMLQMEIRENMEGKAENSNAPHASKQYLLKLSDEKDVKESSDSTAKADLIAAEDLSQANLYLTKSEDASASQITDNESPVKEQRLPNLLSNVHKLLPSPEALLLQLEKERAENQSLDEKSK